MSFTFKSDGFQFGDGFVWARNSAPVQPVQSPTNLQAVYQNDTEIQISFDDVNTNELGTDLQYSLDGGITWIDLTTLPPNVITYNHDLTA